ncbi:hypothetical protein LSH36_553g01050 [Paralvinella palmiformis]|uniref:DM domain-containing protein n=1 Tax=Paralvinella palmiformis TaxID=53620 RepID=A0AAD9J7R7_9ANNE|nr:hypothetical protein LSH36_553g01050 [Paralvinella palmiformis]
MDELGVDEARTDDGKRGKVRYCARCQNHGISEELKGHKRHCPYRSCRCTNCEFTQLRQSVMVKVGHLGRHRGDVSRASPGGKRPRDAAHDDDVTVKDGAAHRQYPGVERTTNNNSNNSSSDESSSATPPSDSANVVVDVTSSSPIERLRTSTDSPALLSDNQGSTSTNGAFVPTSSFGAVSPPGKC